MLSENRAVYEEQSPLYTYECDVNQSWKPAAFFQHMTAAANDHVSKLGIGHADLFKKGLYWVLSRMKLKFHGEDQRRPLIRIARCFLWLRIRIS